MSKQFYALSRWVNSITNDLILKMIDPRGMFGETKYYGDPYYDLAKLMHSCDGGY